MENQCLDLSFSFPQSLNSFANATIANDSFSAARFVLLREHSTPFSLCSAGLAGKFEVFGFRLPQSVLRTTMNHPYDTGDCMKPMSHRENGPEQQLQRIDYYSCHV